MNENNDPWVPAPVPAPREFDNHGPRAKGYVARKTLLNRERLLAFLRDPHYSYDGSNASLSEHLKLSEAVITRLVKGLQAEGKIKVVLERKSTPNVGVYTIRTIFLKKEGV